LRFERVSVFVVCPLVLLHIVVDLRRELWLL
jgi:hypothetical protein